MRIALKNTTDLRNDDLRDLFRRTLRAVGYAQGDGHSLEVMVSHARRKGTPGKTVSGLAAIGYNRASHGRWVKLVIPRVESWTEDTFREIVAVTIHECMHLVGTRHRDMTDAQFYCTLPLPAWAEGLHLRPKEKQPALPREQRVAAARASRVQHVERMLAKAELRAKQADRSLVDAKRWSTRSNTLLKKWQRRKAALSRGN